MIGHADNAVVLLAAGKGSRMLGSVEDKILAPLAGRSVFRWSLEAFLATRLFGCFVVVGRDPDQIDRLRAEAEASGADPGLCRFVTGGNLRQDSVFNGLVEVGHACDYVFIHDCARPLVRPSWIETLLQAVMEHKGATLARPVTDTIKRALGRNPTRRKTRLADLDRRKLWAMETPQAFAFPVIFDAYQRLRQGEFFATDDTSVANAFGQGSVLVEPDGVNLKITRPEDLEFAEFCLLRRREEEARPVHA